MNKFKDESSIPNSSLKNPTNKFNRLKNAIKNRLLQDGRELPEKTYSFIERWQLKQYYKKMESEK